MTNPDPLLVRAQLERILGSETFATAGRHSRLLRFLVERTLAGEGEQLKEYVLGTEVFDRAGSYDPRLDSIVRVEVRRLRSRLDEYYRGSGAQDPIVINIPRGNYTPVFSAAAQPPTAAEHQTGPVRRRSSHVTIAAVVVSSVVVMIATGVSLSRNRDGAAAANVPAVVVLPFDHYSTESRDALLVAQLTDAVTASLAKMNTVSVVSRTTAARYADSQQSVTEIAKALNVDYVVEASAAVTGDVIHIVVRLIDGRIDRKVWVGEYDARSASIHATAQQVASDAAAQVRQRLPH